MFSTKITELQFDRRMAQSELIGSRVMCESARYTELKSVVCEA